jgi:hypothetical protein
MLRRTMCLACRTLGFMLLITGLGHVAFGGIEPEVPEIDPASASSAIALLVGAALIARDKFRSR